MNLNDLTKVIKDNNIIRDKLNNILHVNDIILYCLNTNNSHGLRQGIIQDISENMIKVDTCKIMIPPQNCICINTLLKQKGLSIKNIIDIKKQNQTKNKKVYPFYCIFADGKDGLCFFKPTYTGINGYLDCYNELLEKYNNINIFPCLKAFKLDIDIIFPGFKSFIKKYPINIPDLPFYLMIPLVKTLNKNYNKIFNLPIKDCFSLNISDFNIKSSIEFNTIYSFNFIEESINKFSLDLCDINYSNIIINNIFTVKNFQNALNFFWNKYIPYLFNTIKQDNYLYNIYKQFNPIYEIPTLLNNNFKKYDIFL